MSYDFDLFVIGGGSGGVSSARKAAEYGAKVGIAEYQELGGTCLNRGCIPKKLMVYASGFANLFEEASGYGWEDVQSRFNWSTMMEKIHAEIKRLNGVYQKMLQDKDVEIIRGYARFVDNHTVEINERQITADKILIAVGGHPVKPDFAGIDHAIVSDDMFKLTEQPQNVVIIGGGYIGVEFACIMNKLGSDVTMVLRGDRILKGFDDDLSKTITEHMQRHGIKFLYNSEPQKIEKTEGGYNITLKGDSQLVISTDAITLAATGRKPSLQKLGLENTGVKVEKGSIVSDKYNCTDVENIYAVGDCTNQKNLTPVAISEGRAFVDTVFGGNSRVISYENIPTAVFSNPEGGTVGMTQTEAEKEYGKDKIKIYSTKFRPMYYTLAGKEDKTMMKLVVNQENDRILGVHMVGNHASEIIQAIAVAVKMGVTKADFNATICVHPTSAEELVSLV